MRRDEAMAALLSAQAKPKQHIDAPEVAPRPSTAGTTSVQYPGSVRGRMTIAQKAEVIAPTKQKTPAQIEHERLVNFYAAEHERGCAAEQAEKDERERKRKEAHELEAKRKWKIENDARVLREAKEHQQRIREQNFIKAAIRAELTDATAEEVTEVLKRVRAERCSMLPAAYGIHLAAIREEAASKK